MGVIARELFNLAPTFSSDRKRNPVANIAMGTAAGAGLGGLLYGGSKLSDILAQKVTEHRLNKLIKDTEQRKHIVSQELGGNLGPEDSALGEQVIAKNTRNLDRNLFHNSNDILNHHSADMKRNSLIRKILMIGLPALGAGAGYLYSKTGSDKMSSNMEKTAFLLGFAKFAKEKGLDSTEADALLKIASRDVDRAASDASALMRGGVGVVGGGLAGGLIARIIGKMRGQNDFTTATKDVPMGASLGALGGGALGVLSAKLGSLKTAGGFQQLVGLAGKLSKPAATAGKAVSKVHAPTTAAPSQSVLIPKLRKALPPKQISTSAPHPPRPAETYNLDKPGLQAEGGLAPQAATGAQSPLIPKSIFADPRTGNIAPQFADPVAASTMTAKIRPPAPPNSSASGPVFNRGIFAPQPQRLAV